jgi:hypothetical protein
MRHPVQQGRGHFIERMMRFNEVDRVHGMDAGLIESFRSEDVARVAGEIGIDLRLIEAGLRMAGQGRRDGVDGPGRPPG